MGWLRERFLEAGHASADKLASYLKDGERWPADVEELGERSLGNNLRALDQGRRLRWWRLRPELLEALASAIQRDPGEVTRLLLVHPRPSPS
jgi:hypothetical protein